METERVLLYEAGRRLRKIENIKNAQRWVRRNPEGFAIRLHEFEGAIQTLNSVEEWELVPTPKEAVAMYKLATDYESINMTVDDTYRMVADKSKSGEWGFASAITDDPNRLASAFLIEGYGLFVEQFYKKPGIGRKFVLAIEEVLLNTQPNSRLLKDVIGWMKAESDDFSPEVKNRLKELSCEDTQNPLDELSTYLNMRFERGDPAYNVLDQVRQFPKPILVDFNNVIANNMQPLRLNPDAPAFLNALREIGNVFIVTSAPGWKVVQGFMEKQGVWHPDMVLMTSRIYEFLSLEGHLGKIASEGVKVRQEFLGMAKSLGWSFQEEDLIEGYKRVAPIFCKPFEIPFIDNDNMITTQNPGVLGILVQEWISEDDKPRLGGGYLEWLDRKNLGRPSLTEAVEIVRRHYSNIP